jgi:hypothetical protein
MNIIFLDVDGVLNNIELNKASVKRGEGIEVVCPDRVKLLKEIVRHSRPIIVLSSTWRLYDSSKAKLKDKLALENLYIFSQTKSLGRNRCEEIWAWLDENGFNKEGVSVTVLDDDLSANPILSKFDWNCRSYFAQTYFYGDGLTKELADKVIEFFNTKLPEKA